MAHDVDASKALFNGYTADARKFIRHLADMPIKVDVRDAYGPVEREGHAQNVSSGGICFSSEAVLPAGTLLHIQIPVVSPPFEVEGRVAWCCRTGDYFDVGVEFFEKEEVFRARMVEQICHIEHYRQGVRESEGRDLSAQDAALEWIARYAAQFPDG